MAKIILEKVVKELKIVKVLVTSYGPWVCSAKHFSIDKPCYDSQWPLAGQYFKCWATQFFCYNFYILGDFQKYQCICLLWKNSEMDHHQSI